MITTFVLVHGAFCGAAVWSPLVRELALRGHRALAVDLPGHGLSATVPDRPDATSGMARVGTADDVAAVTAVVERAARNGPVVLVGTSRGGLTVTAVANAAFPDHPFDVHDLRSSHLHFQLHPEGLADVLTGA